MVGVSDSSSVDLLRNFLHRCHLAYGVLDFIKPGIQAHDDTVQMQTPHVVGRQPTRYIVKWMAC